MKISGLKKKELQKNDNMVILTVVKPDADKFGSPVKIQRMRVIIKFVAKVLEVPFHEDDFIFQMLAPDEECDALWFRDNVFRYVNIDDSGKDIVSDAKADKLVETYYLKDPDGSHKVSIGIVKYYVDDMYMKKCIWGGNDEQ